MKGMIASDFLTIAPSLRKWTIAYALLSLGICLFAGSSPIIVLLVGFIMPHSVVTAPLLMTDERRGWSAFRLTLPLSRADVVIGRYASIGAVVAGSVALAVLAYVASCGLNAVVSGLPVIQHFTGGFDAPGLVTFSCAAFALAIIMFAVLLPFLFALGTTKALNFVPFAFMMLIVAWIYVLRSFDFSAFLPVVDNVVACAQSIGGALAVAAGVTVAALAIYMLSGALALNLFRRREL